MCDSEADIDAQYHFSSDEGFGGGFNFYRSQIEAVEIWPMAVLLDIEVPDGLRCRGLGTAALKEFLEAARSRSARLAFLRVGWVGELSDRDRTVSWYQRRGWQLLRIPPVPGLMVPFMYRELSILPSVNGLVPASRNGVACCFVGQLQDAA